MPRKKTRLAYIAGTAARNASLRKRRHGLLKKVSELSILCDVPACAVIYAPNEPQPEVWPSPETARGLLHQFNAADGVSKANNMMDQEKFLAKQLVRVRTQLGRVMAENADLSGELLLRRCLAGRPFSWLGYDELRSVDRALYCRAEAVKARILQISAVNENPLQPPLFSPEVEEGLQTAEIQTQLYLMAPEHVAAPPAGGALPEIKSKQGIFIETEQNSGELPETSKQGFASRTEAAEQESGELAAPFRPVEAGVMETDDSPAAESKQGISIESEQNSGELAAGISIESEQNSGELAENGRCPIASRTEAAEQQSGELAAPFRLMEVSVMETDDLPAGESGPSQHCYGGAAAPEWNLPEISGVSFEEETRENYLLTWDELESYFLMDS